MQIKLMIKIKMMQKLHDSIETRKEEMHSLVH
jgi:hypothetical protein